MLFRSAGLTVLLGYNLEVGTCLNGVEDRVGACIEIYEKYKPAQKLIVAPLAGAWIEIFASIRGKIISESRSPRGSVD